MSAEPHSVLAPTPARDRPGILLPPPLIPVLMLVAGIGLQTLAPLGWLVRLAPVWRIGAGAALTLAGFCLVNAGRLALQRRGTNVNPYRPSLAVETNGVYARTRNPIYVGGITFTIGVAVAFGLDWLLLLQPIGFAVLHFGIVRREERYLKCKFGSVYRTYADKVRRYL